jgi:hypothetical protein
MIGFSPLSIPIIGLSPFSVCHLVIQCGGQLPPNRGTPSDSCIIGRLVYCDLIKRLSPVAWQHINLIGKYQFRQNQKAINIQEFIETVLLNSEINFGSQMQA